MIIATVALAGRRFTEAANETPFHESRAARRWHTTTNSTHPSDRVGLLEHNVGVGAAFEEGLQDHIAAYLLLGDCVE